ncbi:hypothetical protein, partial [Streptomyces sp. NPDC057403]|uniref:hypothetical protein n=1 Tax=Streptomyces sp. NPDC057403 TaxID=3346119 RepID=UPI0036BCFAE3
MAVSIVVVGTVVVTVVVMLEEDGGASPSVHSSMSAEPGVGETARRRPAWPWVAEGTSPGLGGGQPVVFEDGVAVVWGPGARAASHGPGMTLGLGRTRRV